MVKTAVPKVLMVNYEYPPLGGGGGVLNEHLAEELAKDLDVTVLTSQGAGLPSREVRRGARILRVPVLLREERATASLLSMLSFFPSSLRSGLRLMREERFDLVHSFFAVPSACSGILLARRASVPHVLSLLGGDVYDPTKRLSPHRTPLLSHTVKELMERSERVVAMSRDIQARAIDLYDLKREIDLIPHGIAVPSYPQGRRADFGFDEDEVILLTIGRLVPRKGLEELIRIVAEIGDPRLRLGIVGDGPLRADLEERARVTGLGDRIRFLGYVSDRMKWQLLSMADIYVSTALHEGFGIVFLEAMEAGLPIVTYDEGGQVDFLSDGETALVIPLGRADLFARGLRTLIEAPSLRHRMAENQRRAVADFHIDTCAAHYRRVYSEALEAKG